LNFSSCTYDYKQFYMAPYLFFYMLRSYISNYLDTICKKIKIYIILFPNKKNETKQGFLEAFEQLSCPWRRKSGHPGLPYDKKRHTYSTSLI